MERRAAQQKETRHRIVDAAVALHAERGIIQTKPAEIAARANVALTTYYKHFPTMGDLVLACTTRGRESLPPPDPGSITALPPDPGVRIASMVQALFEYYEAREPWLYTGWTEERFVPELKSVMERLRGLRDVFVGAALEQPETRRYAFAIATTLVGFWTWRTLRREVRLGQEEAIRLVTVTIQSAAGVAGPASPLAPAPAE